MAFGLTSPLPFSGTIYYHCRAHVNQPLEEDPLWCSYLQQKVVVAFEGSTASAAFVVGLSSLAFKKRKAAAATRIIEQGFCECAIFYVETNNAI